MDTALDVAEGYARNYLIPRGLAIPATSKELNRVNKLREAEKRKEVRLEEKAREDARKLKAQGVTIRAKAGMRDEISINTIADTTSLTICPNH